MLRHFARQKNGNKGKETDLQQQKNGNRVQQYQIISKFGEQKKGPSTAKKMEEKYVYTMQRKSTERSASIKSIRKRKTEQRIEEEYGVNRAKIQRRQDVTMRDRTGEQAKALELKCNSRQRFRDQQNEVNNTRFRLMRARSNDSLSKFQSIKVIQEETNKKLDQLRQRNAFLKQTNNQSLKRIEALQHQKAEQRRNFQGEQKVYEKQIQVLRSKIQRNKIDIGHLFSYQSYDPFKLVVKPIIEVQENSSIVRSLYNTSKLSDSKEAEHSSEYGLMIRRGKRNTTETTCMPSIDDYRDISQL